MGDHIHLLNVRVDRVDFELVMDVVRQAIRQRRPHQIVTVNVDFLKLAKDDPSYRHLINTADLSVPDGMPLLWAARLIGLPLPERITGPDVVLGCAALAAAEGRRLYLLGAAAGVADSAARELERRFPGVDICGTYSPPFGSWSAEEERKIIEQIRAARPDMLFVAFGAPRQDVWIREHMAELNVPVSVGVGGTLNFLAGRVRRAPVWMQDLGLEWLYRIIQEPRRLWKRYFLEDLPIFLQLLAQPRVAEEAPMLTAGAVLPSMALSAEPPRVPGNVTSR